MTMNIWEDEFISIKTKCLKTMREMVTNKQLSLKAFFIFITIIEHIDTNNICTLTASDLAKLTNTSRTHIYEYIHELQHTNYIIFAYINYNHVKQFILNTNYIKNTLWVNEATHDIFSGT